MGGRQGGLVGVYSQESETVQDVWEEDEERKNRGRKTGSIWDEEKCKNKDSNFFVIQCHINLFISGVEHKQPPVALITAKPGRCKCHLSPPGGRACGLQAQCRSHFFFFNPRIWCPPVLRLPLFKCNLNNSKNRGEGRWREIKERERDSLRVYAWMLMHAKICAELTPGMGPCFSPSSVWLETLGVYAFTHLKSWKAWWSDRAFVSLETDDTDLSTDNV